jgi:hypothetical protein
MCKIYIVVFIAVFLVAHAGAADINACMISGFYVACQQQRCDQTVIIGSATTYCAPRTYTYDCTNATYVWVPIMCGNSNMRLYESPEREINGYNSTLHAYDWTRTMRIGSNVTCVFASGGVYSRVDNPPPTPDAPSPSVAPVVHRQTNAGWPVSVILLTGFCLFFGCTTIVALIVLVVVLIKTGAIKGYEIL